MRNEGSEVQKKSKIILAGKVGKMVAGEKGLKNSPIENGPIQCFQVVVVVFHCKWAQAGPVLFCQRGGCASYCGSRGVIIQY
jgi:hypothetical protein